MARAGRTVRTPPQSPGDIRQLYLAGKPGGVKLGHSSIQITLDTYSHVAPGLQEAAAKQFDEVLMSSHNASLSNC